MADVYDDGLAISVIGIFQGLVTVYTSHFQQMKGMIKRFWGSLVVQHFI